MKRPGHRLSRRRFLETGLALGGSVAAVPALAAGRLHAQAPAIVRSEAQRPALPQGVATGDAGTHGAVVWSRTDRPARMFVEYSTTDRFPDVRRVRGPAALAGSDYTARLVLTDLPPGQRIFYRVTFQDLSDLRTWSAPVVGSFRSPSPPGGRRTVTLAWSADTAGQGWGINPDWGGLRLYETMRRVEPDIFIHCGDTIYADNPIRAEVTLEDGTIWKNLVTEAKAKVAETVDDFRGNYKYNLLDEHMRRFNAEVAQIVIWDDHEVRDNWYETRDLSTDERYQVKSAALLAARARQAFLEFNALPLHGPDPERIHRTVPLGDLAEVFALDLRSYRGPNSENRQPALTDAARLFGAAQMDWLKAALAASRATWKVIASDLPIGLVVGDGPSFYEAIANGDDGPPLGREIEVAGLLRFIRDQRIRNVVWVTGDVHYCAAHHYDPARARFTEFHPFWEFVAGPLNAGTFGPGALDPTFGPEVRFHGLPPGMKGNRPPSEGLQFFGTLTIDPPTRALTAKLHNLEGNVLFTVELSAEE
jgi:alkaline phosphatase D